MKNRKPCSAEFFKAAEEITGPLSEAQRNAIAEAVEHYLLGLEYIDSRPSPAAVQEELGKVATAADELAKKIKALSREARLALYGQPGAKQVFNDRDAFAKGLASLQKAVAGAISTSIQGRWSVLEAAVFGRVEPPYQVLLKGAGRPSETLRELFFIDLLAICKSKQKVQRLLPVFVAYGVLRSDEVPWYDSARSAIDKAQKSPLNPKNQTTTTPRQ